MPNSIAIINYQQLPKEIPFQKEGMPKKDFLGRTYQIMFNYQKLSPFKRVILLITACAATIFTLLLGLASARIRTLWIEAFRGTRKIVMYVNPDTISRTTKKYTIRNPKFQPVLLKKKLKKRGNKISRNQSF